MEQINRRALRHTLGSRVSRRNGSKSRFSRRETPKQAMKRMIRAIERGEKTMADFV